MKRGGIVRRDEDGFGKKGSGIFDGFDKGSFNKDGFDVIAERWAEMRAKMPVSRLVELFASALKPGGAVLDVGCGSGCPEAKYLSERGFQVTGIDVSDKMVREAVKNNIVNARFIVCDFFDFAPEEKYDGIVAVDSFFYFPLEKQPEVYARLANLAKPGCYVLFTHGNKENEGLDHMFGEPFVSSALDKETVLGLLRREGFRVELSIDDYDEEAWVRKWVVFARKG